MKREIPLTVTIPGTLLGLIGATLWPWPWPYTVAEAQQALARLPPFLLQQGGWALGHGNVVEGLYPWPFWGPLPDFFAPGGNWQTGLVTGLVGALVGTFLLRAVRFIFSTGIGMEALGMGDADLMMMAGAFLGWQPVVISFFVAVIPGLAFAAGGLVVQRDNRIPFGPSLAIGIMATCLLWSWIGPAVQVMMFHSTFLGLLAGLSVAFLFLSSVVLRIMRYFRGQDEEETEEKAELQSKPSQKSGSPT